MIEHAHAFHCSHTALHELPYMFLTVRGLSLIQLAFWESSNFVLAATQLLLLPNIIKLTLSRSLF